MSKRRGGTSDSFCGMRDWTNLLSASGYELRSGVIIETLRRAETALGRDLPPALTSLYQVSDGVADVEGQ